MKSQKFFDFPNQAHLTRLEMECIVQVQAMRLHLLARAASIPESEIESISLAQELTEEQLAFAQGEFIPSVAGSSGSARSRQSTKAESKSRKPSRSPPRSTNKGKKLERD